MMYGLGCKPDPFDARDHSALEALRTISAPDSVPRSPYVKVLDQGPLGSCVANAAAQVIRHAEVKALVETKGYSLDDAQNETKFLSRLWLYYAARAIDGTTKEDSGTHIRNAFAVMNKLGFPPEDAWPYDVIRFDHAPPAEALRMAYDQREANGGVLYRRIDATGYERVDAVKQAVASGYLVEFGTPVSQHFCSDGTANGGRPIDPPTSLPIAGGHALVVGGYDFAGADILNSWSADYGDNGWCRFSWDYIAWDETHDLWIAERVPFFSSEVA